MTKRGMLRQSDSLCAKGIVPDPFPEHIVFSLSANISTPRWHFFCNDRVTNLSLFSLFCKDGETKISFQTCGRCQADLINTFPQDCKQQGDGDYLQQMVENGRREIKYPDSWRI